MGTVSPDITKQTTEVGREQVDQNQRFQDLLDQAYATLNSQSGQTNKSIADSLAAQNKLIADQAAQQKTVNDANQANSAAQLKLQTDEYNRQQATADQNAAQARADATAKQNAIAGAQKNVSDAFAGYDDNYYNNYTQNFINSQKPVLDQKYDDIQHDTALGFASKGTLDGSAAVRRFGIVAGQKAADEAALAQQGSDATSALRNQVATQENQAMQNALFAATLTPNVPIQGLADPKGPAGPASAPTGTTPADTPSYAVTQPKTTPVAGATVDSTLTGSTVPAKPPTTPVAPPQFVNIPGIGSVQLPDLSQITGTGASTTKATPGLPPVPAAAPSFAVTPPAQATPPATPAVPTGVAAPAFAPAKPVGQAPAAVVQTANDAVTPPDIERKVSGPTVKVV